MGFHLLIFCTFLSSVMRSTWPNQFNICFLRNQIIFCPFNKSSIYTQQTQERNIHALRGVLTRDASNQTAADPRI
jgi:uncharacterized protein YjfI (DUF2170 family)